MNLTARPSINKILALLIVVLFQVSGLNAQGDSTGVNSNPYSVVYNHLYYLQNDNYQPEQAALSLPKGTENAEKLALKLKQILDGKGLYLDLNRIPSDADYRDSVRNEAIYVLDKKEPQIYVEKLAGQWSYSRTTVQAIPSMHQKLYPFGTQFITYFSAPGWQIKILGIKLWKWLGLLIILAVASTFYFIVRFLSQLIITRFLKRRMELTVEVKKTLFRLSRIIGFILSIRFVLFFLPMFQIAPSINAKLISFLNVLSLFFLIIVFKFVIKLLFVYFEKLTTRTENTMDDQLLPVLYKLSLIILWAIGIIYIFDYLGVNITALIAGLSIGGLALALAAQDTVKNFFGSVMIFLDKPFQIGDLVEFDNIIGTIEEVGVRSTRIRTLANSLIYIPNAKLADSVINNLGIRVFRAFKTELGVTYDTAPESIENFVEGIREIIQQHPMTLKDKFEVHLNSFGASSLNVMFLCFFDTRIWSEELKARHEVMVAILKLADAIGVRFAFPTQTIHIEEVARAGTSNTPASQIGSEARSNREQSISGILEYFNSKGYDNNNAEN